jgi:hypothetical protein
MSAPTSTSVVSVAQVGSFLRQAEKYPNIQAVRLVPKNEVHTRATNLAGKCPALIAAEDRNLLSLEVERQVGYVLEQIFPSNPNRVIEVQGTEGRGRWAQCTELDFLWGSSELPQGFLEVKTCTAQLELAQELLNRSAHCRTLKQVETQGALLSKLNPLVRGGILYVLKDELPPPAKMRNGSDGVFFYSLPEGCEAAMQCEPAAQLKRILDQGFDAHSLPIFITSMSFIAQIALQMGYIQAD